MGKKQKADKADDDSLIFKFKRRSKNGSKFKLSFTLKRKVLEWLLKLATGAVIL